jgi:hypothetical protein
MPDERSLLCLTGGGHATIRRLILCANGIGNPEKQNSENYREQENTLG